MISSHPIYGERYTASDTRKYPNHNKNNLHVNLNSFSFNVKKTCTNESRKLIEKLKSNYHGSIGQEGNTRSKESDKKILQWEKILQGENFFG